ncbi:hypothetical protein HKX54_09360 [Sulfitobacter sp. M57]|uniref:hypothetical protein n=1 Tax=unclassified Sulfitobacter TaxID=196795 RepID=UPI0023E28F20|nr:MULTISPECIES: hypothetical protein [unclassified Sulfitobacter]MDF3414659.1 hypothetical protein [Sulfitobacter sp. KE5]MDF3422140.1 hypothetical protein [Sulfitobacter sp. KE43]MDF3433205.1 hypothetical protein [Sulfitobacter sp. KE42]MDF3458845.1 hypothetical protein [Sulfitobacter sp. S74]MDF3462744.1 hypothetical protein [Sulfitobacter sp. Ks18]
MNIPVLIVACITLLAFVAHLIGGTRETASLAPAAQDTERTPHWVQAMCAFQMLSVDLLAVALALFAIALWDMGPQEANFITGFGLLYLAWAAAWVIQLRWLNRPAASLLRLPHWTVWIVCAALLLIAG